MTDNPGQLKVHPAIRLGGAFMLLAVAIVVFTAFGVFRNGVNTPVPITTRVLLTAIAAMLIGAAGVTVPGQKSGLPRVAALGAAVVLLIASRFISPTVLTYMEQYWLVGYAVIAGICAAVLRRAAAGHTS